MQADSAGGSKSRKKKGKKGKNKDEDWGDDEPPVIPIDSGDEGDGAAGTNGAEPEQQIKKTKSKKGKAKKGGGFAALISDDDAEENVQEPEIEDEPTPTQPLQNKKSKKKDKKKKGANAFAEFMDDDENDDGGEQDDDMTARGGGGFAGLDVDDSEEDEQDEPAPQPTKKSKKKDKKKRGGAVGGGFAALMSDGDDDDNAQDEDGDDGAGRGFSSSGFGGLEVSGGGDDDEDEAAGDQSDSAPPLPTKKSKKKDKNKKKGGGGSSFAALMSDGDDDEGEEEDDKPRGQPSGFAGLDIEDGADDEDQEERDTPQQSALDTRDASNSFDILADKADGGGEGGGGGMWGARAEPGYGKKKKEPKPKTAEDEELDALLAELDAPKEPQESKSKKKKKKNKRGGADQANEASAGVAGTGDGDADKAGAPDGGQGGAEGSARAPAPAGDQDGGGQDEFKLLSKKEKKKLQEKRKKEREREERAAARAAEAASGAQDAATVAESQPKAEEGGADKPAAEAAAPAAAAPPKGKKMSKQAMLIKQLQEERKRLEEERKAAEEAERLAIEEEERREAELKAKAEEEAEKKRERDKMRKAKRKEEGKLLTTKQREEQKKLEAKRAAMGLVGDIAPADLPPPTNKKPVYGKKKKGAGKGQQQQQQQAQAVAEEQPVTPAPVDQKVEDEVSNRSVAADVVAPAVEVKEEVAPAPAAAGADDDDDWDADDWDMSNVTIEVQKTAEEIEAEQEAKLMNQEKLQQELILQRKKEAEDRKLAKEKADKVAAEEAKKLAEQERVRAQAKAEQEEERVQSAQAAKKAAAAKAAASKPAPPQEEESEESESDYSEDEDESSSEYSSSEYSTDSDAEFEAELDDWREARAEKLTLAMKERNPNELRAPIVCILGHVDTGKTKILDNIRNTNVQDGEAGGITQQIGATYIPGDHLLKRTAALRGDRSVNLRIPALLVIDTPGHEAFANLRSRGSGLCDVAVLVVDLMHGLEQQTKESIELLLMRGTPFIIALNKVDRLYGWKSEKDGPIRASLDRQSDNTRNEFEKRYSEVKLQLNEVGLNVDLYWQNRSQDDTYNVVPTSAITGEGIPDMLQIIVALSQQRMQDRLMFCRELECTVMEVKMIEGLGTSLDVVLVNGQLNEGDKIVVCGLQGPIVTQIRALLTPHALKEQRVKGSYQQHKSVKGAIGLKVTAPGLESAISGTQIFRVDDESELKYFKSEVQQDMQDIFDKVDKGCEGVYVQASTLGSLEALLVFLSRDDVDIPVRAINIGPVQKRDIIQAAIMNERARQFSVILAFDVKVSDEMKREAAKQNVTIFHADIIYHLQDQFQKYRNKIVEEEQDRARQVAVFPCIFEILPDCVFNVKNPLVLGCTIKEGQLREGTPVCVPNRGMITLGRVSGLERDHKAVKSVKAGESAAVKIQAGGGEEQSRLYGRHFDFKDPLYSHITRESIDALKSHFRGDMEKDDWRLVVKLKKLFEIQ